MCFLIHPNHNQINITEESIPIVKYVVLTMYPKRKIDIASPFYHYKYYKGNIDYGNVTKIIRGHLRIVDGSISEGFHSYIALGMNLYQLGAPYISEDNKKAVFEVLLHGNVPPRSEYMIDPLHAEIVSNKIRLSHKVRFVIITGKEGTIINSVLGLYDYISKKLNW